MTDESAPLDWFRSIPSLNEVYDNAKTFYGRPVTDYEPDKHANADGSTAFRFRSDWDENHLLPNLRHFVEHEASANAVALVIGAWHGDDHEASSAEVVQFLVDNRERLAGLRAIYIGDIVSEENEISWIKQSDIGPLLSAFPSLELLRARGGDGLRLSSPAHASLRALTLETGGLPVDVVRDLGQADLPNLEHLELWLGTEEYGGNSSVEDLQPLLSGELFPKLRYLGLRNCEYADNVAAVIVNSPLVERIETLDLSLGVLSDEGGQPLLSLPGDGSIKDLRLHHHYLSDAMVGRLKDLPLTIDTSNPDHLEDEWRFVAISE